MVFEPGTAPTLTRFSVSPTLLRMTNSPSLSQLQQAVALKEQIAALETQLTGILSGAAATPAISTPLPRGRGRPPGKGGMSAGGRARIAAAQKARWAKFHASSGAVQKSAWPKKGGMSRAERGRVAAKARWAKYRESQGTVPVSALPKKRNISPASRARMAAAVKAWWARYRKEKAT